MSVLKQKISSSLAIALILGVALILSLFICSSVKETIRIDGGVSATK